MSYHFGGQALGVSSLYCNIGRRCVVPTVKAEATEKCQQNQRWGPTKPDCAALAQIDPAGDSAITDATKQFFSPCAVANNSVPVCSDPAQTFSNPTNDDDSRQYAIGGILAAVVVGIGYAVFKNRKKRGRR